MTEKARDNEHSGSPALLFCPFCGSEPELKIASEIAMSSEKDVNECYGASALLCRRVTVEKGCDICQEARCKIETTAEKPAHGFDGDAVTCDYCGATGRMVCNGLDNDAGTEGYDIVWIDPETGEDYVW